MLQEQAEERKRREGEAQSLSTDSLKEKTAMEVSPGKFFGRKRVAHAPKSVVRVPSPEEKTTSGTHDKVKGGKRQVGLKNFFMCCAYFRGLG